MDKIGDRQKRQYDERGADAFFQKLLPADLILLGLKF